MSRALFYKPGGPKRWNEEDQSMFDNFIGKICLPGGPEWVNHVKEREKKLFKFMFLKAYWFLKICWALAFRSIGETLRDFNGYFKAASSNIEM